MLLPLQVSSLVATKVALRSQNMLRGRAAGVQHCWLLGPCLVCVCKEKLLCVLAAGFGEGKSHASRSSVGSRDELHQIAA